MKNELIKARVQLLIDKPFFGNLTLYLKLKQEENLPACLATDGKHLIYSEKMINIIKQELVKKDGNDKRFNELLQFGVAHEVSHLAFSHFTRMGERDRMRWNFATDYAINLILKNDNMFVADFFLCDEKYKGMSAEQIYNLLPKGRKGRGSGLGEGDILVPSNGEGECEGNVSGDSGDGSNGIGIDKDGNINIGGKKYKFIDHHQEIGKTQDEKKEIEQDWKINATKSYQQSKMQGKAPAGLDRYFDELLNPKLDWRTLLKQYIVEKAKNDYSWTPPNRRHIHNDIYLPSITSESCGDICVGIDSSGSISDKTLHEFVSEVGGILNSYSMRLHLFVADAIVHTYKEFSFGEEFKLEKEDIKGRGGTDMTKILDKITELNINPTLCIILTDGHTSFGDVPPFYPVLWVLEKDGIEEKDVPYGNTIKIS